MTSRMYQHLANDAVLAFHRGDHRTSADKYLDSFVAAPSKWAENRWHILHGYTSILCEKYFPPSQRDFDALERIAADKSEPFLYRSEAAWSIGLLRWDARDRDGAAEQYRRALRYADKADAAELRRRVMCSDDSMRIVVKTAGDILDDNARTVRGNLGILEDPFGADRSHIVPETRQSDGSAVERDVRRTCVPFADIDPERLIVGGDRCDGCRKTLAELNKKVLSRCPQCKMAFYCSRECQVARWKGHKQACRRPGQFEPGDYVKLTGLQSRQDWNEWIVKIVRPAGDQEGRWVVLMPGENRTVSVASKNLEHIRPAK